MATIVSLSDSSFDAPDFADLMAEHQGRLLGYIRSLVPDVHSAKDILQEANMTLLKKASTFEPGTNFTAWAFRVAYFEVLTFRRKRGRDRMTFDDDLVEQLAISAEKTDDHQTDRVEALKSCISKLPDKQREVIVARYLEAETVAGIAKNMGTNPNAISQTLFRARTNLAKCVMGALSKQARSDAGSD